MKEIAGKEDEIRSQRDDSVDSALKRARDVRLTLIDASRSKTLVLSVTEMEIR